MDTKPSLSPAASPDPTPDQPTPDRPTPDRPDTAASHAVVSALVQHGLVAPVREDEARGVVARVLAQRVGSTVQDPDPDPDPDSDRGSLRRRVAEVAGYLGAAFIVAAATLFLVNEWDDLTSGQRVALLVATTLVLAMASAAVIVSAGGPGAVRTASQAVRRRLAGVLAVGAACTGAFAAGVLVESRSGATDSEPVLAAAVALIVIAVVGYLAVPTVLGQLALATGVFILVPSGLDVAGSVEVVPFGLLILAAGVGWAVLAERSVWQERQAAQVIGCVLALTGAQIPAIAEREVGYLATVAVAVAAFVLYVVRRAWPYLVTGVAAVTLVVPEALIHWTDGSFGSAGTLLVTGVTLLVASLLGLRLRHEVEQPS